MNQSVVSTVSRDLTAKLLSRDMAWSVAGAGSYYEAERIQIAKVRQWDGLN